MLSVAETAPAALRAGAAQGHQIIGRIGEQRAEQHRRQRNILRGIVNDPQQRRKGADVRLVQEGCRGIRKHRDARRAQRPLIGGKALAAAQQNTEIIVPAGTHALLAAHSEAALHHFRNAAGDVLCLGLGVGTVHHVNLTHSLIGGVLVAAHHKALAVPIIDAAQTL